MNTTPSILAPVSAQVTTLLAVALSCYGLSACAVVEKGVADVKSIVQTGFPASDGLLAPDRDSASETTERVASIYDETRANLRYEQADWVDQQFGNPVWPDAHGEALLLKTFTYLDGATPKQFIQSFSRRYQRAATSFDKRDQVAAELPAIQPRWEAAQSKDTYILRAHFGAEYAYDFDLGGFTLGRGFNIGVTKGQYVLAPDQTPLYGGNVFPHHFYELQERYLFVNTPEDLTVIVPEAAARVVETAARTGRGVTMLLKLRVTGGHFGYRNRAIPPGGHGFDGDQFVAFTNRRGMHLQAVPEQAILFDKTSYEFIGGSYSIR